MNEAQYDQTLYEGDNEGDNEGDQYDQNLYEDNDEDNEGDHDEDQYEQTLYEANNEGDDEGDDEGDNEGDDDDDEDDKDNDNEELCSKIKVLMTHLNEVYIPLRRNKPVLVYKNSRKTFLLGFETKDDLENFFKCSHIVYDQIQQVTDCKNLLLLYLTMKTHLMINPEWKDNAIHSYFVPANKVFYRLFAGRGVEKFKDVGKKELNIL